MISSLSPTNLLVLHDLGGEVQVASLLFFFSLFFTFFTPFVSIRFHFCVYMA